MAKARLGKEGAHIFEEKDIFAAKPLKDGPAKNKKRRGQTSLSAESKKPIVPWYKKTVRKTFWIESSVAKRTAVYCALKGLKESPTVNRLLKEQLDKIGAPKTGE